MISPKDLARFTRYHMGAYVAYVRELSEDVPLDKMFLELPRTEEDYYAVIIPDQVLSSKELRALATLLDDLSAKKRADEWASKLLAEDVIDKIRSL